MNPAVDPAVEPAQACQAAGDAGGESATQVAKALGVSRATIYRHADVVTEPDQS